MAEVPKKKSIVDALAEKKKEVIDTMIENAMKPNEDTPLTGVKEVAGPAVEGTKKFATDLVDSLATGAKLMKDTASDAAGGAKKWWDEKTRKLGK